MPYGVHNDDDEDEYDSDYDSDFGHNFNAEGGMDSDYASEEEDDHEHLCGCCAYRQESRSIGRMVVDSTGREVIVLDSDEDSSSNHENELMESIFLDSDEEDVQELPKLTSSYRRATTAANAATMRATTAANAATSSTSSRNQIRGQQSSSESEPRRTKRNRRT